MPFLELTLSCSEVTLPRFQNALDDVGAMAVTMLDADADTSNERALLKPGVGEMPLWDRLTMTALFDGGSDALVVLAALEAFDPGLDWSQVGFRTVEDSDWIRAWIDLFKPMQFGARTFIVPWNQDAPEAANARTLPWCGWIRAWPTVRHASDHGAVPALAGQPGRQR